MFVNKLRAYYVLLTISVFVLSGCTTEKALSAPPVVATTTIEIQTVFTPTLTESIPSPTATPESGNCTSHKYIEICVHKIVRADIDTQVTLKIFVENNMVNGEGNSFIRPEYENLIYPLLRDEKGNSFTLIENDGVDNYIAQFDEVERVYYQTLYFQPVPAGIEELTVSLPMIIVDIPADIASSSSSEKTFKIDLGESPQPGQAVNLDVTTVIDGQTFHFVKAEFEGDGTQFLRVTLYTDPLNLPSNIYSMSVVFGDSEKSVLFGTKRGINGLPLRAFADLVIPPGKSSGLTQNTYVSGVLDLEVNRINYSYRGPFEITFQLP